MRQVNLMDCTLRDGGYINNWHFGCRTIENILQKLSDSNIEFIECGYLSEKKFGDENDTQFKDLEAVRKVLPKSGKKNYAVMIDFGQYAIEHIPNADEDAPIIRVCFHHKDVAQALQFCKQLIQKGYTVFVQPMASLNYTDVEFVELIRDVNAIDPAGFYIVDSFGVIEIEDFQRLLFLTDHNLKSTILLGYHAHNNLQQAYGNAKYMVEQKLSHDIILDASVYGMGRGAGNLNMELFASYLNKNYDKAYHIDSFLEIMDEYLKPIFAEHFWGYSLPYYLSAQYNCHPNYANYFADKNTLNNLSMRQLLASLPEQVKCSYSVENAEQYYREFQRRLIDDSETLNKFRKAFENRNILIISPGKTVMSERQKVETFIRQKRPIIIAINVIPDGYHCDYLFCANEKRLRSIESLNDCQLIVSSNIECSAACERINYSSYLSEDAIVSDNPTLMMIRLMITLGICKVNVAGFDGYNAEAKDNYFDEKLALGTSVSLKTQKNALIKKEVRNLQEQIKIEFVTSSKYNEAE